MLKEIIVVSVAFSMLVAGLPMITLAQTLDSSYWASVSWTDSVGSMDYNYGTINFHLPQKPDAPWKAAWGKQQATVKDKLYVLSFDAFAANQSEVPVSLRINQNYAPYRILSNEKYVYLSGQNQRFTVELYATDSEINATISVWVGHRAGDYRFSNVSLQIKDPDQIIPAYPLDSTYWSNQQGAIDYAFGTVDLSVPAVPEQPWMVSWGKTQAVMKDKVYVLSFDAKASAPAPISARINQNYAPWANYSSEEIIHLTTAKQRYTVELYSVATDHNAVIGVWVGHAAANYEFSNIALTVKDPDQIIPAYPLDSTYWSNQQGAIDYAFGTMDLSVPAVPEQPWMVSWGKTLSPVSGKTYVVSFDARAVSHSGCTEVPISLRINKNYAPWDIISNVEIIELGNTLKRYHIPLTATQTDINSVIGVWAGHAAANYEFSNISVTMQ